MASVTVDHDELKRAMKEAILEIVSEQPTLLLGALVEMIEDIGLAEAIRRGRETEEVPREEIEAILRGDR